MKENEVLVDEDAKRVNELTRELADVCKRRGWPVISVVLATQGSDDTIVCLGVQSEGTDVMKVCRRAGLVGFSMHSAGVILREAAIAQGVASAAAAEGQAPEAT